MNINTQFQNDADRNDIDIIISSMRVCHKNFKYASDCLKDCETSVILACTESFKSFAYASYRLRNSLEFLQILMELGLFGTMKYATYAVRNDCSLARAIIKINPLTLGAFKYVGETVADNFNIMFDVVSRCTYYIRFASERLRHSQAFVFGVLKASSRFGETNNGFCLRSISEALRDDKEIILLAVAIEGRELKFASDKLRNDREVAKLAITNSWYDTIKYVGKDLLDDLEFGMFAVQTNGGYLSNLSAKCCADFDIVLFASLDNNDSMYYASPELKKNLELALLVVGYCYTMPSMQIKYFDPSVIDNKKMLILLSGLKKKLKHCIHIIHPSHIPRGYEVSDVAVCLRLNNQ